MNVTAATTIYITPVNLFFDLSLLHAEHDYIEHRTTLQIESCPIVI
jgi:hypothetical protein